MSKTILELCRELPGSEAELRQREREFSHEVAGRDGPGAQGSKRGK